MIDLYSRMNLIAAVATDIKCLMIHVDKSQKYNQCKMINLL